MITLTDAAARMMTASAAIATAMGRGTTDAEVQAIASFLLLAAQRRAEVIQVLKLDPAKTGQLMAI